MPKPAHVRLEFSGVFGSLAAPIEEWSFGLSGPISESNNTKAELNTLAIRATTAYAEHIQPFMRQDVRLTRVRAVRVTTLGTYGLDEDGSYLLDDITANLAGTSTAGVDMPLQTALVVSLTTERDGATGRGRFFLPFPVFTLGSDRLVTVADAESMATSAAAFVGDVNGAQFTTSVVSSAGYSTSVTGVRVGRVPDTMRSRRERRAEGYAVASLPN